MKRSEDLNDIDMYPNVPLTPALKSAIDKQIGRFSEFNDDHQWEVETVGPWMLLSALPGWEDRCVILTTPLGVVGKCLCPLDIAYNKAEAGRPKDIEYLAALFSEKIVLPLQIKAAIHVSIAEGVHASIQAAIKMSAETTKD